MGRSAHLLIGPSDDAGQVRENRARDEGRTVLEAVVALTIVAITATAWAQTATVAVRTDDRVEQREQALDIAVGELEALRVHDDVALGTAGAGGAGTFEGLPVLTDAAGPVHQTVHDRDSVSFTARRYVLDPGSDRWRRLVVVVSWPSSGDDLEVRLDTGVPVLPAAEVS